MPAARLAESNRNEIMLRRQCRQKQPFNDIRAVSTLGLEMAVKSRIASLSSWKATFVQKDEHTFGPVDPVLRDIWGPM
jgi:hypothetical protein